ncbi:MAG: ABC transporter substrate-binding protein [Actinomycetota bacterium]
MGVLLVIPLVALSACSGARNPKGATGETAFTPSIEATTPVAAGEIGGEASATPTITGAPSGKVTGSRSSAPTGGSGTAPSPKLYPPSTLFTASEDRIGITKDQITLCYHLALTYGSAFQTGADDMNVYYTAINEEKGGVYGRKIVATYENDNYDPQTAVQAATACKAKNPFLLLGGFGMDQVPAVRNWAEQNHQLYLHTLATVNGSEGKKYSFTQSATVEKFGEMFAELAVKKHAKQKIGIIKRNSPNWEPGVTAFKAAAKKYGLQIVAERAVQASQANYTQEILDMKKAGAQVVWAWDNAMASIEIVRQAKAQLYSPVWMMFPFNMVSQTAGDDALNPPLEGVAAWPAFSKGDYTGSFASYADAIKEFERQYAKYRSGTDISGISGDLLFMKWMGDKYLVDQLMDCGPDCTRNRLIDTWHSYTPKKIQPSPCQIDFSRHPNRGGYQLSIMEAWKSPSGKVNWANKTICAEHII